MTAADATNVSRQAWACEVVDILGRLPALQGDVLRLLYFEHLRVPEAADRLGVSVRRARTAAADGLRNLGQLH